ncbi:uncharacterized protein LOC132202161 isoform X2 [Neocloeon triangulifer]|uniref:uncharacterized protein LOC132202161 isoform X2 n=1 Tax=Neocloeon triangulifer TaxID=2078957 RepID=UPI00286ED379|nr:uncharacterized protein LOC132202161 isoform X2 [Neocloeon triangulifer]
MRLHYSNYYVLLKMVRYCGVKYCNNSSSNFPGMRFFSVPLVKMRQGERDRDLSWRRRLAWISALERTEETTTKEAKVFVCEEHFVKKPAYFRNLNDVDWAPTLKLGKIADLEEGRQETGIVKKTKRKRAANAKEATSCVPVIGEKVIRIVEESSSASDERTVENSNETDSVCCVHCGNNPFVLLQPDGISSCQIKKESEDVPSHTDTDLLRKQNSMLKTQVKHLTEALLYCKNSGKVNVISIKKVL